jgi:hypothetical protein
MRKSTIALLTCLAACATATADQCCPPDEIKTWRFLNDTLRVESVSDSKEIRNLQQYVRITRDGHDVAVLNGTGFDTLAASADESLFVGISNQGWHETAVVVFDRQGSVRLQVKHHDALFDYCMWSVSIVRQWHGSQAADVHFENGNDLDAVTLLDCKGNRVNLVQTVSDALARGLQGYREWKAREKAAE